MFRRRQWVPEDFDDSITDSRGHTWVAYRASGTWLRLLPMPDKSRALVSTAGQRPGETRHEQIDRGYEEGWIR